MFLSLQFSFLYFQSLYVPSQIYASAKINPLLIFFTILISAFKTPVSIVLSRFFIFSFSNDIISSLLLQSISLLINCTFALFLVFVFEIFLIFGSLSILIYLSNSSSFTANNFKFCILFFLRGSSLYIVFSCNSISIFLQYSSSLSYPGNWSMQRAYNCIIGFII